MNSPQPGSKIEIIKGIYLYLVTFVALMMIIFSTAHLINTALKTWIFTKADMRGDYYPMMEMEYAKPVKTDITNESMTTSSKEEAIVKQEEMEQKRKEADELNRTAQRQRDIVRDISFLLVGIPLFLFHWREIKRKK